MSATNFKGYIDAVDTVQAAQSKGLSVCDYVEAIWDQKGCTDKVITNMKKTDCLKSCNRICEIGPGTGRYLERVLEKSTPDVYEIYETAEDWGAFLESTYAPCVIRQPADGRLLKGTTDQSCGLIHAHGVFVYLNYINCFEYFSEMIRGCKLGGFIVFDYYSSSEFNVEIVEKCITEKCHYPVILDDKTVNDFFLKNGAVLMGQFQNKYGVHFSTYNIYKRVK